MNMEVWDASTLQRVGNIVGPIPAKGCVVNIVTPDEESHAFLVIDVQYTYYSQGRECSVEVFVVPVAPTLRFQHESKHQQTS